MPTQRDIVTGYSLRERANLQIKGSQTSVKFECGFSSTSLGIHRNGAIGQIDIHLVKCFPIIDNFAEVLVTYWYFWIGFVRIGFVT